MKSEKVVKTLKILNICNAFMGTKVHRNLAIALDQKNVQQTVFTVVRKYKQSNRDNIVEFANKKSKILFSRTLKIYHRVFFKLKVKQLYKDLVAQESLNDTDVVHATTLFTDGAIAYRIWENYNVPYIITVRSADLDFFMKYRPDLLPFGLKILKRAKAVVFVSPSLKKRFLEHWFIKRNKSSFLSNIATINNGIDDFWIDNSCPPKDSKLPDKLKLLYVGRLVKRKNIHVLIEAVKALREAQHKNITLRIVGSGGDYENEIRRLANANPDFVTLQPAVNDKKVLLGVYRDHDAFAMPSFYETFGLVYIEALSQGLPILYAKDDGIDGVFPEHSVGESANPKNLKSIVAALKVLATDINKYKLSEVDFNNFRWGWIADTTLELYQKKL